MSTGILRPSATLLPVLLGGCAGAVWFLVFFPDWAAADDCLQYVKNVKNFVAIPRGLLEDCMRTGSVQAIITATIGTIGGGITAKAISDALKDAAKQAGPGPHVVPDPGTGTKPDGKTATEAGAGGDGLPEAPPDPRTREGTPDQCRSLYDQFQAALAEANGQNNALQIVKKGYMEAFENHRMNLGRVTVQLGIDAADMASAGVGAVKGGMGVARALDGVLETLRDLIVKSVNRSHHLETLVVKLIEDIAEIMGRSSRYASMADEAGRLSAKAESKIADLVKEAASLEGQAAKFDDLVRFSRSVDGTMLERNAASKVLGETERALGDARKTHEEIKARRQDTADWAAREKMDIVNEDARNYAKKQEELHNARTRHEEFRAETAEAAKKAHTDWQGKMSEVSAAKKELDEARVAAAHLQKQKQAKILAEQDALKAKGVRDEAGRHLDDAEANLKAFDDAERAKFGGTREERLATANQELGEAKAAAEPASRAKKEAQEALATFNQQLDHQEPDFWKMSGDDLDARGLLDDAHGLATQRVTKAEDAIGKWKAANPDTPDALPPDLYGEYVEAHGARNRAYKDLRDFDWEMEAQGKGSQFTPEQVAEHNRLKAVHDQAVAAAAPGEAQVEAARATINQINTPNPTEFASGQRAGSERSRLRQKVVDAKQQSDYANKLHQDAEAEVGARQRDLEAADLSGTGEPMDNLHRLEGAQSRYDTLLAEQEAARVKYEQLKGGGGERGVEAAARIDRLEGELRAWKEPDVEATLAARNPDQYASWKEDLAHPERVGAKWDEVSKLQEQLGKIRVDLATIERKLADEQAKTGGKSTAELEAERDAAKQHLADRQSELTSAKEQASGYAKDKNTSETEAKALDEKRKAKEAEKKAIEEEKKKADEETRRLEEEQRKAMAGKPVDHSGLGPDFGGEWSTYKGSTAEEYANWSHEKRKKFGEFMDNITPDALTWPFRKAGELAGKAFHAAFGGQSPEEVAAILKKGDLRVREWTQWLKDAEKHFEAAKEKAKKAKEDLDACTARNAGGGGQ